MMTTETSNTADRRVYVACLGAYNSGRLVGEWLDTCGIDERVPELIKAWRAQGLRDHGEDWGDEWAVHDHEFGDAWPSSWGEQPPLDQVDELAEVVEECGVDAFRAFMGYWHDARQTPQDLKEAFQACYCGDQTPEEYAEQLTEESGELENVPDHIRFYIDWEGVARDMSLTEVKGHLFNFDRA